MSTDLYALDLRAVGVKDRDLTRLIAEVERLRERRTAYAMEAEKARRDKATLPERLRDAAATAIAAGEDPADEAKTIADTEWAVTITEARADAAAQALRDAERAVEAHMAEVGGAHRSAVRDVVAKDREKALGAVDEVAARVEALLADLSALLQFQPIPTHGRGGRLPSQDRRQMGAEYGTSHPARKLVADLRAEVEALVPPSEEAFAEAASAHTGPGFLHRPPADEDRWAGLITTQATPGQAAQVASL